MGHEWVTNPKQFYVNYLRSPYFPNETMPLHIVDHGYRNRSKTSFETISLCSKYFLPIQAFVEIRISILGVKKEETSSIKQKFGYTNVKL